MKSEQKPALEEVLEYHSEGWRHQLCGLGGGGYGLEVQGWEFQQSMEIENSGECSLRSIPEVLCFQLGVCSLGVMGII